MYTLEETLEKIREETNIIFKDIHDRNTGHVYIRPVSNLKPFSDDDESVITEILKSNGIGIIRNRVLRNFTVASTQKNYGFRLFYLNCSFHQG